MKKLKFMKIILALGLLLALTACGGEAETSEATNTEAETESSQSTEAAEEESSSKEDQAEEISGEVTQITFWHAMGGTNGEAIESLAEEFNASQDEIQVTVEYQGSYPEIFTKLKAAASANDIGADLVQINDYGTGFMINSDFIVPIQEYIDADGFDISQFEENLLAYYTVNDQLYSMPFNSSTPILYYNKDIFEQAGIDEVPTTMEEIKEIAPQLVDQGGAQIVLAMATDAWFAEQWMNKSQNDIFNKNNGRDGNPTEVVFPKNGGMEKTYAMWKDMVQSGVMPQMPHGGGTEEFASGIAAMRIASTASLKSILTEVDGRFEVATAYYPAIDDEDQGGVSIGGASLWMIDTDSDETKDATWEFVKFMVSPESQAKWNRDTGYFPVTTEAHETDIFQENIEQYPQFQTAIDQLHDSSPEDRGSISGINGELLATMETYIEMMIGNDLEPIEATNALADDLNGRLEEYNRANNIEE